jgi:hypothetical protein
MISLAFKFPSGRFRDPLLYPLSHRGVGRHEIGKNSYTKFHRAARIFDAWTLISDLETQRGKRFMMPDFQSFIKNLRSKINSGTD